MRIEFQWMMTGNTRLVSDGSEGDMVIDWGLGDNSDKVVGLLSEGVVPWYCVCEGSAIATMDASNWSTLIA
jgi:hypothetical protein